MIAVGGVTTPNSGSLFGICARVFGHVEKKCSAYTHVLRGNFVSKLKKWLFISQTSSARRSWANRWEIDVMWGVFFF